ncbi:CHAD domain-containing protein [Nocardia panacis]|uniref:CHAD domain-containing protein n=1 Tax=Nocardia panacis TaxID=2340916 RepID=A0A3A4K7Y6_9NOCA|nr:CHAD domain-containing protein [Nocardia panacis]RJO69047.1 CHAD domain-containing protein [Nocardia panacis]
MTAAAGPALVTALGEEVDRLLAVEPEVRADADDSIHQMRVATRRLRSILRSYRGLFEEAPVAARQEELAWLAAVLGVARDAEVRADRFAELLATEMPGARGKSTSSGPMTPLRAVATDLVEAERTKHRTAHARVLAALDSGRYHRLRTELRAWRTEPPLRADRADRPAVHVFEKVLRRDRKRLRRLVYAEPAAPAAERIELLHDIRKSAKRLRYSCEDAAAVLGPEATELGRHAKRLQTVLGDHRDAIESRDALLSHTAEAPVAEATIYRTLAEAEDRAAVRALADYPDAAAFVCED